MFRIRRGGTGFVIVGRKRGDFVVEGNGRLESDGLCMCGV